MEIDASLIPLPIFPLVVLNITLWIDPFDMSFLGGDVLRGNIGLVEVMFSGEFQGALKERVVMFGPFWKLCWCAQSALERCVASCQAALRREAAHSAGPSWQDP